MSGARRHRIVIVGGGSAGISVAARLRRANIDDVAIVDPAEKHYYQPLWTLVGAGVAPLSESVRDERDVIPAGVTWIQEPAAEIHPGENTVVLDSGTTLEYEYLVICPGIQLDWDRIPGVLETLGDKGVSSNYRADLAPRMWEFIEDFRSGTAVFTMPTGAIKCPGAPQKIAYLASDYWRKQGVLDDIRAILVIPGAAMFGIPEIAEVLDRAVARYGIDVRFESEVTSVDPVSRQVTITSLSSGETTVESYDLMHFTPPQSAPDWLKKSAVADPTKPEGWVEADQYTLQHPRFPNVFSLGDATAAPNSKTGAAIRKQAPVVVENLRKVMAGAVPDARYNGYASCPLTTARNKMLLAEFDYTVRPTPSIPLINTIKERRDMWYLKRYGLPWLYWNLMLKGRA